MRRLTTKATGVCILIALILMSSCGQTGSKSHMDTTNMRTKMDMNMVPKGVTNAFYNEYPMMTYGDWYGYPAFAKESSWYEYYPYYQLTGDPDNYVFEFNNKDTAFKAIYAKDGTKIASHKTIFPDIPTAITEAINKSNYQSWTVGKEKEEIFKDKETDELKVYKIIVSKDSEKHTLYFQQDGKILKDVKSA